MAIDLTLTALLVDTVAQPGTLNTLTGDGALRLPAVDAPERTFLECTNLDAVLAADLVLLRGTDPPAHSAGRGDLAVTLSETGGTQPTLILGPFSSSRFLQADGSLALTLALHGGAGITIIAYQLPRL